jgi:hypothetical protein
MLFGYPIDATLDNWFNDCMLEILSTIHSRIMDSQKVPSWPEIIPKDYREHLSSRTGLRDRLIAYQNVIEGLPVTELNHVVKAMDTQNEIVQLLSGTCSCESIDELPEAVRGAIKGLFYFGFELLTDLKIRDQQYWVIYESSPHHICPFCGCEYFDAPGAPREALDHYLPKSIYPFAAANLQNLVPMGNKCNSKYKLAQDPLFDENGIRRKSFFPYGFQEKIQIDLNQSVPFEGGEGGLFPLPKWEIRIEPNSDEVKTWDTVFHIRERFERDILDAEFNNWLNFFSEWCRQEYGRLGSSQTLLEALEKYASFWELFGYHDRSFLKAALFRMLLIHCQQGNDRLIQIILSCVNRDEVKIE